MVKATCQTLCQRPTFSGMRLRLPECIVARTEETGRRWDECIEFAGQGKFVHDAEQGARGGHDGVVEGVARIAVCERGFAGGPSRLTNADER